MRNLKLMQMVSYLPVAIDSFNRHVFAWVQ